jgi:hypothetical protein
MGCRWKKDKGEKETNQGLEEVLPSCSDYRWTQNVKDVGFRLKLGAKKIVGIALQVSTYTSLGCRVKY